MTFKPLQRLNFMKRVGFSAIVIMIAFIIMIEVIDKSIIHLTLFDYRNQFSLVTTIVFVVITSVALFVQSIFLSKIYSTKLFIGKLNSKILYNIPLICHLVTIIVVIFLMIEIIFESRYGKFLILISIWLNVSIGISILAGLVFRLIIWLKESSKKNTVVILYVLSISVFVALNALILSYFSLGYRTGLNYVTSTTSPTYIFATSNTTLSIAITTLSILSFILIWISSILLLGI